MNEMSCVYFPIKHPFPRCPVRRRYADEMTLTATKIIMSTLEKGETWEMIDWMKIHMNSNKLM